MQYIPVLILCTVVFGGCFLADKGFTRLFRNRKQHRSGLSVRHNKKVMAFGLIAFAIGVSALLTGGSWIFYAAGALMCLVGTVLVVSFASFGIYYDEDSFLVCTLRKKNKTYAYKDICSQQLYNNAGSLLIELHMSNGDVVQLQGGMPGLHPFLDKAFAGWLRQTDRKREDCSFYDPENYQWFPGGES